MIARWRRTLVCAAALVAGVAPRSVAQSPARARVVGTVFDSVTMTALSGALVRIVRADDPSIGRSAQTDSTGAFSYDSVAAGVWIASFLHPVVDSLRVEAPVVRLDIVESGTVTMPLVTRSPRALLRQQCGEAIADDLGVLLGEVRRADSDAPVVGATVMVEWPEWILMKRRMLTEQRQQTAVTDSGGRYVMCGAPSGSTVRARTSNGADTSGVIEVQLPERGYAVQDFALAPIEYATPAVIAVGSDSSAVRARRGRAQVAGRVTSTSGAPLPNVAVRVIGTGSVARTSTTGEFTIADAGAGTQTIEARVIGYQPVRRAVRLLDDRRSELTLTMAPANVELDTVRVVAGRSVPLNVRGIEQRWRTGLGRFLDGKTVVERAPLFTSDALRGMPGVFVVAGGMEGNRILMRNNRGDLCVAILYIDGMPMDVADQGGVLVDDFIRPEMVAAIEVYNRPTMAPAEYLTMARNCGVVAVWTKYATNNVPVIPPPSVRRGRQ